MPRILLATDGTLTHILEAYANERIGLVKLSHSLVTDPSVRSGLGLDGDEVALRRIILLRGAESGAAYVYADSVVMLDRLPSSVAEGLLDTDIPIGKLLCACRAETYREILSAGEEHDEGVAAHFGLDGSETLVSRTYQIVHEERPIVRITEKFPRSAFSASER